MVFALEQIETHLSVRVEHIAQNCEVSRGKTQNYVHRARENDVFIYRVVVLLTDTHQLARDQLIVLDIAPELAVHRNVRECFGVDDSDRLDGQNFARVAQADYRHSENTLQRGEYGNDSVKYFRKRGKIEVFAQSKKIESGLHRLVEIRITCGRRGCVCAEMAIAVCGFCKIIGHFISPR